jgi:hypothetical protein
VASCAEASFDFGLGEAAARKLVGAPRLAADAATTPTTTMAAAAAEAISNVRRMLIRRSSYVNLKEALESGVSL